MQQARNTAARPKRLHHGFRHRGGGGRAVRAEHGKINRAPVFERGKPLGRRGAELPAPGGNIYQAEERKQQRRQLQYDFSHHASPFIRLA